MEEDIKILEEFIKYYESEAISRKFRGTLSISVDQYDIDAIEHLIKAYKELEEENQLILNSKIGVDLSFDNYIPKSLVEDKIEEILNNKEYIIVFEGNAEFPDDATIINAQKYIKLEKMQELIEEREEK